MPEGDTVWLAAKRLNSALAGQRLTHAELRVPALATTDLTGGTVREVVARGKHMLTRLDTGVTLHSHLRLDGSWQIVRAGARWSGGPAYTVRVLLANASWQCLGYRMHDLAVVDTRAEGDLVGHLGPDVLGPDWDLDLALARLSTQPDREIGPALLDQRNLAGIGNMYRAEMLFVRGVHPWTAVGDVTGLGTLVDLGVRMLRANREHPEQSTTGSSRRGQEHWVYARAGQPCRRCGTPISTAEQGTPPYARVVFWCPRCQPSPA